MHPSTFYHVYNRANGSENLFREERNYYFFLKKFAYHINPIANTYAYCLMPNHFHFLLRINNKEQLIQHFNVAGKPIKNSEDLEALLSKPFGNLFNSYTKAYNKTYGRKGSLFIPNVKRKEISSAEYLANVLCYIHNNPIHHGFVKDLRDWPYSSYHTFFSQKNTHLKREEALNWFGNSDSFITHHQGIIDPKLALEMEFY